MVRPCVLYNKRALQITAALDAACDHLDRATSFDDDGGKQQSAATWAWDKGTVAVRLQRNHEVAIRTLAVNGDHRKNARGEAMKHVDPILRMNRDFIHSAVRVNGLALQHAPDEFKEDRELVMTAVRQNGLALEFASRDLKNDCEICSYAVAQTEGAAEHLGPEMRECYEVMLAADRSGKLREDKKFMMRALLEEPHLLQYCSKRLLVDFDVVAVACHEDGLCLAYASKTLRAEQRVVRLAVEQNGLALQYAGGSMRNSINIVSSAIRQNGLALQFASEGLKADKRVVLRALQFDGMALQFASADLKRDKGVVIRALKENVQAWKFANSALRRDPEFSSKRLQKLLSVEHTFDTPTEDEVEAMQRDALGQEADELESNDTSRLPFVSEAFSWPDHPPNGALMPTRMLVSPTATGSSFNPQATSPSNLQFGSTTASSFNLGNTSSTLPPVRRSSSTPALAAAPFSNNNGLPRTR